MKLPATFRGATAFPLPAGLCVVFALAAQPAAAQISAYKLQAKARAIHERAFVVDSHEDTPSQSLLKPGFEGGPELTGLANVGAFPNLTLELVRRGYSARDLSKIWSGNLFRVMQAVARGQHKAAAGHP